MGSWHQKSWAFIRSNWLTVLAMGASLISTVLGFVSLQGTPLQALAPVTSLISLAILFVAGAELQNKRDIHSLKAIQEILEQATIVDRVQSSFDKVRFLRLAQHEFCSISATGMQWKETDNRTPLEEKVRGGIQVRMIVCNPGHEDTFAQLNRRLGKNMATDLTIPNTRQVLGWNLLRSPNFKIKTIDFTTGWEMVIIDPNQPQGRIVIEFYGVEFDGEDKAHNGRIHSGCLEISKERHPNWFRFWFDYFEVLWSHAADVVSPTIMQSPLPAPDEYFREDD